MRAATSSQPKLGATFVTASFTAVNEAVAPSHAVRRHSADAVVKSDFVGMGC